ncbi:MAG: amidohydrolase [Lachnospiraceae bacterium]|nr:amidohydrolase [Lachnospiraceae bacterium]HCJ09187.1 metal-dependent hydrolase [Lachnospiraceae bacterium]
MVADIVVKGNIFTSDPKALYAEAFAVKDGRFIYVGDADGVETYIGEETRVITPGRQTIFSGIGEGHAHVCETTSQIFEVDIAAYKVSNIAGYQEEIRKFVEAHPDRKIIHGRGFLNGVFPNGMATKEYLDEISTDIALVMTSEDGHSMWCNSKALELCKLTKDTPDIKDGVIGRDADGTPNGAFRETAMSYLNPVKAKYSVEDYKEAILHYQKLALSYGIHNVFEPMSSGEQWQRKIQAYKELIEEDKLKVFTLVGSYIEPDEDWKEKFEKIKKLNETVGSERLSFQAVKMFVDGVVEGHTAWLKEEYADAPGDTCECLWKPDDLKELCATTQKAGYVNHIHAIGDAANSLSLDAYQFANDQTGVEDNRNTITHVQLISQEDYERFARLHVIAAANPYWHYRQPFYYEELEVRYLGRERADNEYPMKSFLKAGAVLTEASDWPVSVPCNPFRGLEYAVTRQPLGDAETLPLNPKERLTVEEMLQVMTINGAYQVKKEKTTGSIEVGKDADFVIVDRDLFTVDPHTLHETKVVGNYEKGKLIYAEDCK